MTRLLARETHGMTLTSKHEEALLKAQEKQWQAINKDINAEHDKGRADERVKLVELMHNTIKEREYWINPAERGQKREYKSGEVCRVINSVQERGSESPLSC